jgi:DNA-binding transcriptional regulator YbjK
MVKLQVDGRKARGEKRRTELIEATLRIIERDGVAGVTHRTVAAEAGVPTTSTTYHFSSLDDLLIATLISCARDMATEVYWMIDRARSRGSRGAEEVAVLLAEALGPRRGRTMAVRHDDEVAFRVFLAGIDGLLIQGLIDDGPPSAEELRPVVDYLLKPR